MSEVEQVLVVPRELIMPGGGWQGIRADGIAELEAAVGLHGRFEPRPAMGLDRSFKQIIPYVVLRDGERTFLMRRTRAGSDSRLHDRFSIGVGGHVNPGDGGIDGGLRREWAEEIDADFVPEFRLVGAINDDESDVGSVHLGFVFVAEAAGRPVAVRETEKLEGRFVDASELRAVYDRMETWSQLVFGLPIFTEGDR